MNTLKRAILSITRKPLKSCLFIFIIFILATLMAVSISINQASENVEKNIKERLGAIVTIIPDFDSLMKMSTDEKVEFKALPLDVIEKIGESQFIKSYNYSISATVSGKKLKQYNKNSDQKFDNLNTSFPTFTLKGIKTPEVKSFVTEKSVIVEGAFFTQEDIDSKKPVTVISKNFAETNGINVGDELNLESGSISYITSENRLGFEGTPYKFTLKVVGIFEQRKKSGEENSEEKKPGFTDSLSSAYEEINDNSFYTPLDIVKEINSQNSEDQGTPEVEYIIRTPDEIEDFKIENEELLPNGYKFLTSVDNYSKIAAPVKDTQKIAKYVLTVSIIATILITLLVMILFLRDRKHEIGIYISLGQSRTKVISQILIEVVILAIISITLSVFSGNLVAKTISSSMVQSQLETESESEGFDFSMVENAMADEIAAEKIDANDIAQAYSVDFSLKYVAIFYLVGLTTVVLSALASTVYIVRLNPKKIMM